MRISQLPRPGVFASDAEEAAMERAERERQYRDRIKAAGIPARYAEARACDCPEEVFSYAKRVMAGYGGWLMLVGPNGTGKTYAACAVANEIAWSRRVLFTTVKQMVDTVQRDRAALRTFANVPFLVLDDLGKEDATAWKQPDVFDVIQRRDANIKPTVVTTNLTPDQMRSHYGGDALNGDAIVSRLFSAQIVLMDGPDRRLR